MKPPPFDYVAPGSLDEALEVLADRGTDGKLLAGGQSLVPLLNFRLAQPAILIDLNRLDELAYVGSSEPEGSGSGTLKVGAMTRQRTLERDPAVARRAPLLAEALPWIAHPQIRNRGTVGGSLAHADPAGELPALAVALGARFRLASRRGVREVAAEDFYIGLFATELAPDEMLTEIEIPTTSPGTGWAFLEQARRPGDYAQVGLAVRMTLDAAGLCQEAKLVFLSVGERPMVATRAAAVLEGERPSDGLFAEAADLATQEIDPSDDIHASADFKRHLARVLTGRALARAVQRAGAAPS